MTSSKRFWRGWFFLLLISALCGGLALPAVSAPARAAPQMQAATSIVISEFRTRGPGGANDEFVELYNPTGASIDISNWEIWGSNGNNPPSTSSRLVILSGTILFSGQHYLIANSNGYNNPSVPANQTYGSGITDNGGIALTMPSGTPIVDQVGMSNNSAYKEGAILSPLSGTSDQSYERKLGGLSDNCQDTNDNFSDFILHDGTVGNTSNPQNSSSPLSLCGVILPTVTPTGSPTNTSTATSTGTTTNTPTNTSTGTVTNSPTPTGFLSILINEVAWAGTAASTSDEWIELYNPGTNPVNLTGWILKGADGTPNIALTGTIAAGNYFLLERTDDNTVSDIAADQIFSGDVGNTNESLQLWDPSNRLIDTANSNGGNWPAGSSTTFGSMERRAVIIDSDTAWITNTGVVAFGKDANGVALKGTPKHPNWAVSVTATPSPSLTPTKRPTPTRTPTPLPPPPLVAINEFVPRPGHDWNNDGVVNVGDEYIELLNHGVIDVNLSGYSLDDEANIGSPPFRLPVVTIKPGERLVFYGSQTGLLLSDGGDGVRLLKPNGQLMDAYNYFVVRYPDESYCRLPDNGGADDWNQNCFPTPGLQNSLSGSFANPPNEVSEELGCPVADTLPADFVLAECNPFGNNIWNPAYWDKTGWFGEKYLPENSGKWPLFAD
jgi:hypothetical protein